MTPATSVSRVAAAVPAVDWSPQRQAQLLSENLLAGELATTRALIIEVDVDSEVCRCVYSAGHQALAVWSFDIRALRAGAGTPASRGSVGFKPRDLRAEARRLLRGSRLAAVRGSINKVIVVHEPAARPWSEAIVDAVLAEVCGAPEAMCVAPPAVSARAGGECRTVSFAR